MKEIADLSRGALEDFVKLLCGKRIDRGMSRQVYRLRTDPAKVIKIEDDGACFQNVMEWETWGALQYTPAARWLAPCLDISPCGIVLIMAATEPLPVARLPKRVPAWFTDCHANNWGQLGRRVVCHDYGLSNLITRGARGGGMQMVKWS